MGYGGAYGLQGAGEGFQNLGNMLTNVANERDSRADRVRAHARDEELFDSRMEELERSEEQRVWSREQAEAAQRAADDQRDYTRGQERAQLTSDAGAAALGGYPGAQVMDTEGGAPYIDYGEEFDWRSTAQGQQATALDDRAAAARPPATSPEQKRAQEALDKMVEFVQSAGEQELPQEQITQILDQIAKMYNFENMMEAGMVANGEEAHPGVGPAREGVDEWRAQRGGRGAHMGRDPLGG